MKVAFVHDWFTLPGGAEKVAKEIIDVVQPSAIHALFNFMDFNTLQGITQGRGVKTSFLQRVPGAQDHYRHLAPFYPAAIRRLDVAEYDVIISSSWMAAKGVKKRPGQVHLCYCHTPMRFAWGLEDAYLDKYGYRSGWKRKLAQFGIGRLRKWDKDSAQNVDYFVANSHFIAERIFQAYGRKSAVIYPPLETERFALYEAKKEFYFTASRFVDYKNIDLIVQAFNRLPEKRLVIAGSGPDEQYLKQMVGPNIDFVGWLTDEQLVYYMQRAKAFVNASIEDFGIAGIEAQSCGTPVIALGEGGYLETVVEQETGVFFHRLHPEALADAILRADRMEFDPYTIRKNALRFDRSVFRERFLNCFLDTCFAHEHSLA